MAKTLRMNPVGFSAAFFWSQGMLNHQGTMEQVGRYQIRELLGQGAMGQVYLAFDPKLHREVAIKVVHEHIASDERQRHLFHREARAAAVLDHPNTIRTLDYSGADEEVQYIVFERLHGLDLSLVLQQVGALPEPLVVALAYEGALALQHAHEQGIMHRDVKPENLFLEPGRLVLGDFGVAKPHHDEDSLGKTLVGQQTKLIGTPLYMSPEQLLRGEASPASDMFAFGGVLFMMLSGKPAFPGSGQALMHAIVDGRRHHLRQYTTGVSGELMQLVDALLSPEPKDRPDADAVVALLQEQLGRWALHDTRAILQKLFYEPDAIVGQFRGEDTVVDASVAHAQQITEVVIAPALSVSSLETHGVSTTKPPTPTLLGLTLSVGMGVFWGLVYLYFISG